MRGLFWFQSNLFLKRKSLSIDWLFAHSLHKQSSHSNTFMVTYKILLDTRRSKTDGTYAVQIRITYNRQSNTSNTGVFVKPNDWSKENSKVLSSHPNAQL
jgi:hypothetical protein